MLIIASLTKPLPNNKLNSQLGFFYVSSSIKSLPNEVTWVAAEKPDYLPPREDIKVILDWYTLHIPWGGGAGGGNANKFWTEEQLQVVEDGLMSVPTDNFWGTLWMGSEENRRQHIGFDPGLNFTWFNETLLAYDLWIIDNPPDPTNYWSRVEEWKDEMCLRMMRGACEYWHSKGVKVGVMLDGTLIPGYRNVWWSIGVSLHFGWPAFNYLKENFDFVIGYPFTSNLEFYNNWTIPFWDFLEEHHQKQKKFIITTQKWYWNTENEPDPINIWEPEAIALEIKDCLDKGYVIMPYYNPDPPRDEIWSMIQTGIALYESGAPFYYNYVNGTNLLTGKVGLTYGWVKTRCATNED